MQCWTDELIRFRADAARFNASEDALAARMAAHLPAGGRVCDLGCGPGFLSLALARRGFCVTAIDRDARAIDYLRRQSGEVRALCADAFSQTESFDAYILRAFGMPREIAALIARHPDSAFLIVKKDERGHRFAKNAPMREMSPFAALRAEISGGSAEYFTLESGQPFRSEADAQRFFRLYGSEVPPLKNTGDAEFPLFFPAPTRWGMLVLPQSQTAQIK